MVKIVRLNHVYHLSFAYLQITRSCLLRIHSVKLSLLLDANSISNTLFGEFDLVNNSQSLHVALQICLDTFLVDLECLLGFHIIAGLGFVADEENLRRSVFRLKVIENEARFIIQHILQIHKIFTSMFARYFKLDVITIYLCNHPSLMPLSYVRKVVIHCLTDNCICWLDHPSFFYLNFNNESKF